jgi:hypothetical protein
MKTRSPLFTKRTASAADIHGREDMGAKVGRYAMNTG